MLTESALEDIRPSPVGPVVGHAPRQIEVVVPSGTTQIEIWFRTFLQPGPWSSCEAWDSRFGENFWLDVVAAS